MPMVSTGSSEEIKPILLDPSASIPPRQLSNIQEILFEFAIVVVRMDKELK